jgi:putative ABC transport system permease protein
MSLLLELIREALRNLRRHKLRSLLTGLGIVFGIASVMSMVATGEGARAAILDQIQELGIRNILLNAKKPPMEQQVQKQKESWRLEYGLTFKDLRQIQRTVPSLVEALPVHDLKSWIWFKSRRLEARVRGVTPPYFSRLHLRPVLGRTLTPQDEEERARVCVVRARLLRDAGYVGDPLNLDLRVGRQFYRVVGVLPDQSFQSATQQALGIDGRSLEIYVPFETTIDRYSLQQDNSEAGSYEASRVELHQIVCVARSEDEVPDAARCLKTLLDKFHVKRDWEMTVPLELLESRQKTQRVFDLVLPLVAGISLLVGGIGILNIMLASVSERTREIGIRRAIGASQWDITWQFLIETVTLSGLAGLMGILLGLVGVQALERLAEWKPVVSGWSVALSLSISCLTGIVFGLYPARRAAQLDPIVALRHV